jgi:4-amino-4-deoxy-L-arabinose transferase-like glycosyltransferase
MSAGLAIPKQLWVLLGVVLAVRLVWHGFGPIGVAGDEAYYWDWSRRLAWGYFSKPPGIAWANWVAGLLSGNSAFGMKAMATVMAVGGVMFVFMALRKLVSEKVAMACAIAVLLLPGNLLLGSFMTTDCFLVFFWNLGLWMTTRLLKDERASTATYVTIFFAIGLGSLFKQMMMVQIPLLWITMLWMRREVFFDWRLHAATFGSLVFLLPVLLWNVSNDWITVEHTAHHFEQGQNGVLAVLERLGVLYGVSAGLLSPVIFCLAVAAAVVVTRRLGKASTGEKLLWLWGVLPIVVMSLMVFRQAVNPNWPAVYFYSLVALAASVFSERGRWWGVGVKVAGGLSVALMVFAFVLPLLQREGGPLKVQRRAWTGYRELAEKVDRHLTGEELILVDGHRFTASQMSFHLKGKPRTWLWNDSGEVKSQYDLWPGMPLGQEFLLVVERQDEEGVTESLLATVDGLEKLESLPFHPSRPETTFHLYRASGLKSWPGEGNKQQ